MPKNDRYEVEENPLEVAKKPSGSLPSDIAEKVFVQPNLVKPRGPDSATLRAEIEQLQAMLASRSSGLMSPDGGLIVAGFQFSPVGLVAPDGFTAESWGQIGELLFRLEGSIQWLIGDWLVYGHGVHYGDLEAFATQIEKDYGTLRNYAYVARSVNLSLRNDKLSYHHHVAVAKLTPDQQSYALAYAVENGEGVKPLPVARFRQWIRDQQGNAPTIPATVGDVPQSNNTLFDVDVASLYAAELSRYSNPRQIEKLSRVERDEVIRRANQIHAEFIRRLRGVGDG